MSKADDYRCKAAECVTAAEVATDRNVRATYLDLAKQWTELARQADMLDRQRTS